MSNASERPTWRLGVVSYLNAKPLIAGLDADDDVKLIYDVPARLPGLLDNGAVDIALVPVIDLVKPGRAWRILSDACIGCDGETRTVRVFSRVPPESVRKLHVDGDSHTSVALATVLWRETYGTDLTIVPFVDHGSVNSDDGVLLIGDKVVTDTTISKYIETDLGSAWKSLTSLPFVFAVWAAPEHVHIGGFARRLMRARDAGVCSAESIATDLGPQLGWDIEQAKQYLRSRLKYTLDQPQRAGMTRFFELAKRHELVPSTGELVFA